VTEDEAKATYGNHEYQGGEKIETYASTATDGDTVIVSDGRLLFTGVIGGRIHMKLL
jgi:signal peptidase I